MIKFVTELFSAPLRCTGVDFSTKLGRIRFSLIGSRTAQTKGGVMSYLETARRELDSFVKDLAKRIEDVQFNDPVIRRYWGGVSAVAIENLETLIATEARLRIRDERALKAFRAAVERAELFLSATEDDELEKATWLIRASNTVLWRLEAMNLLWPELNTADPLNRFTGYEERRRPNLRYKTTVERDYSPPDKTMYTRNKPGRKSGFSHV